MKKKIKLEVATEAEQKSWDQVVDKSQNGTIFHKLAWLKAAAEESHTRLMPLVGSVGDQIAFLLPLFLKTVFGFKAVFSPPPRCHIPELGLVLCIPSKKNDVIERTYLKLVQRIAEFLLHEIRADFVSICNCVGILDSRPFLWNKFVVKPYFTYYVDLDRSLKKIFQDFRSQTRTDIKRAQKYSDLEFAVGDYEIFIEILEQTRARYAIQNLHFFGSDKYFRDIYNLFDSQNLAIRAVKTEEGFLGGLILLLYKGKVMHWIGGTVPGEKRIGLNELLHWNVIQEFKHNGGFHCYDLVGANTSHLCRFKSKFGPELKSYFYVEKQSLIGRIGRALYLMK